MKKLVKRLLFPIIGFGSLLWFLVRVIPKPSRASYPCMRAAAPVASTFVVYILGLFSSVFLFKRAKKYLRESRTILFSVSLILALIFGLTAFLHTDKKVEAAYQSTLEGPNLPMGNGKGIHPGRVAWIYDPDATDENCTNSREDYWYQDDNTDQGVVNSMLSRGLQMITGESADAAAWNALFHDFNKNHGKGDVGYTPGKKIAIKINLNASSRADGINTSPQICHAILDQLVNVVGVAQADIGIGDPNVGMNGQTWKKSHDDFPNVDYWCAQGKPRPNPSSNPVLFASDGSFSDVLPQVYVDAAYLINVPVLKKHHRAGISLCSKNHFGSIGAYTGGAWHLHPSLPCPDANGEAVNGEYGVYRCFVDIMGHKDLGGKTVLFLVDGIWGSVNWGHPPVPWRMQPFNNDWPNSLFLSQDPVAVESVGFDFLYNEFDETHPTEGEFDSQGEHGPFPHFPGVDDYLHQAADSTNWPAGLVYDPENDGKPLPRSMGAHEHWNNAVDKKYTRNLGGDKGIELVTNYSPSAVEKNVNLNAVVNGFALNQNYPNPFNPSTTIRYKLSVPSRVNLTLYDALGRKIRTFVDEFEDAGTHSQTWDGTAGDGLQASAGAYIYRLTVQNNGQIFRQTKKMVLSR
jgi:hypothetical protein